jgi:hypothetical protein
LVDTDEAPRIHFAIPDPAAIEMKLRPIAVPERLGALDHDLAGVELNLPHAPQRFHEDVTFQPQLRIIGCVLILASAASAEHRTRRFHAIGRRLINAKEARSLDVLSRLGPLSLDSLAWQYERSEDDFAIQPAEPFTAVNQLFNVELQT